MQLIDDAACCSLPVMDIFGKLHEPIDADEVSATIALVEKVRLDARKQLGLHRGILQHFEASNAASDGCRNLSICGPDGTKIGTDLNIVLGVAMFQATRKVAVLPLQVIHME